VFALLWIVQVRQIPPSQMVFLLDRSLKPSY